MVAPSCERTPPLQEDQCNAPADSAATQYYCSSPGPSSAGRDCFTHDTAAWCQATALSSGCPILQPFTSGDCKLRDNVRVQFGADDVAEVGIHYGPSSICIGVPGGELRRIGRSSFYRAETACVASECRADGLYILIQDQGAETFSAFPCPAGGFAELGAEDGFMEGVRCLPLLSVAPPLGGGRAALQMPTAACFCFLFCPPCPRRRRGAGADGTRPNDDSPLCSDRQSSRRRH